MKAYIHTAKTPGLRGNDPFHGHEIRLTVGLIVKNEEKNLKKCLASLKPLLDAVPSELIVTDTGSTDRTVEIAEEYADRIIHFDWCDDFSAARNTGLDAAHGEWFLYLDADEWFDDVTPLIDFFNSGECDRYGAAAYIQRNYNDFLGDSHSDAYVCRVFRRFPGIHFQNKIHEDVSYHPPLNILDAFVHHYGYIYRNEEERRRKFERNGELLESELKANPDDLKAILQYTVQIIEDDPEKAVKYAKHGLEIVRNRNPENHFHIQTRFAFHLAMGYFNCHRYTDVCTITDEALKRESEPSVFHLELYRLSQSAAWHQKNYEIAAKYGELYRKLYPIFQKGGMDRSLLVLEVFRAVTSEEAQKSLIMTGQAFLKLDKTEEARGCLESLDLTARDSMLNGSLPFCTDLAAKAEDWGIAVKFYRRVLALDDEKKTGALLTHLNAYYENFPLNRRAMAYAFADAEGDDEWFLLCRLRLAELEGDGKKAADVLDSLCGTKEQWDSNYADIFWYAVKEKKNLVPFLLHIDVDVFPAIAATMQTMQEDYSTVVGNYFETFSFENAKALFCSVCLLERAVLSRNAKANAEFYKKLIVAYFDNLSKFVRAEYKPEILTESGISALPGGYRFGYYVGLALDAKRQGNGPAYLANLRMGLKEYPAMKDCVGFLLKDFEDKQKKDDAQAQEFAALAVKVKQNIEQLIAQGNLKQAGVYTLQLAKLIPEDDDLRRYRKLTHTEPTMNELVTRLPQ